ncbi:hypothetical protein C8R43DRAFT_584190 [Mycena crocata]|nr:hypothetical protein C8R43DRAFT_584190 [Mycena crocata]
MLVCARVAIDRRPVIGRVVFVRLSIWVRFAQCTGLGQWFAVFVVWKLAAPWSSSSVWKYPGLPKACRVDSESDDSMLLRNSSNTLMCQFTSRKFLGALENLTLSSPAIRERVVHVLAVVAYASGPGGFWLSFAALWLIQLEQDADFFGCLWRQDKLNTVAEDNNDVISVVPHFDASKITGPPGSPCSRGSFLSRYLCLSLGLPVVCRKDGFLCTMPHTYLELLGRESE